MTTIAIILTFHAAIFTIQRLTGGGAISEIGFYVCLLLFYICWIVKAALDRYEEIKKSESKDNQGGNNK